jgi:hypothetical protein
MVETGAALAAIKQIDEAVGILAKALASLKGQPDAAALKLAEALEEIGKTWHVTDEAIASYLALGFDPDNLVKGADALLRIEGGGLLVAVQQGRGHCHVIGNIFHRYLDRWFQRVLKGRELEQVRSVFRRLGEADLDLFRGMEEVVAQLQAETNKALNSIAAGRSEEARAHILSSRPALTDLRLRISASLAGLYTLKGEFIRLAGTV